jgi:hypothetical protein
MCEASGAALLTAWSFVQGSRSTTTKTAPITRGVKWGHQRRSDTAFPKINDDVRGSFPIRGTLRSAPTYTTSCPTRASLGSPAALERGHPRRRPPLARNAWRLRSPLRGGRRPGHAFTCGEVTRRCSARRVTATCSRCRRAVGAGDKAVNYQTVRNIRLKALTFSSTHPIKATSLDKDRGGSDSSVSKTNNRRKSTRTGPVRTVFPSPR